MLPRGARLHLRGGVEDRCDTGMAGETPGGQRRVRGAAKRARHSYGHAGWHLILHLGISSHVRCNYSSHVMCCTMLITLAYQILRQEVFDVFYNLRCD